MALLAATNRQVPDHAIVDYFNKQTYLGNQYCVSRAFTIGTSETALILGLNNTQTGSPTIAKSIFQNVLKAINTSANSLIINVYVNPTFSVNGTSLTAVNLRPSNGNNSVASFYYTPTTSAFGTLVDSISATTLTTGVSQILKIIDAGQSILFTGIGGAASTSITAILQWYEL